MPLEVAVELLEIQSGRDADEVYGEAVLTLFSKASDRAEHSDGYS